MEYAFSAIGGAFTVADANDTAILSLQNKTSSPFLLKIHRVLLMSGSLTAVTGVGIQIDVDRLTAVTESGGVAGVLVPMDDQADKTWPDIPSYVSAYTGATTFTVGDVLAYRAVNNEEITISGSTGQADIIERTIWSPAVPAHPLVIKPTQAVAIIQRTNSTAGAWIPQIDFTIQRQKG